MGHVSGHKRQIRLGTYLKNAVSNVKSFIVNKAIGNISPSSLVSNFGTSQIATKNIQPINQLLKKSPFEIDRNKRSLKHRDPLGFQHLQYPSELTGNELGNWILFLPITTNVGDNPANNPDFKLAEDMGMPKVTKFVESESGDLEDPGKTVAFDEIREQYKKRGIDIPRVIKTNTTLGGESYRTKDIVSGAIALYMPPDIKVSYGQDWGPEDMGVSGDVANAIDAVRTSDKEGMELVNEVLKHGSGITMQKGKEFVSAITSGAGMGDWVKLMGKGMGLAINNHAEMFYEGPKFRSFDYSFRFWPRNPTEVKTIQDIIKMFKWHMHPERNTKAWHAGRMFEYPSEFEIHYLHRTTVNENLNKISRCALTDMALSYTPSESNNFKTFEDHSPVSYGMTLTFKELEYLTKDKIGDGF